VNFYFQECANGVIFMCDQELGDKRKGPSYHTSYAGYKSATQEAGAGPIVNTSFLHGH
jgi:hypothetical protein